MKKKSEIYSRREFFKQAAKGVLPILGLTILGPTLISSCGKDDDEPGGSGSKNHEYVDLGLPSGTLWATCNIGADSPEDYGDYFAWAETKGYKGGKTNFDVETYKYGLPDGKLTKYCSDSDRGIVDNKRELEPSDDAATVNWGSSWRMPSKAQIDELINSKYTTTTWTNQGGVNGLMIVSKSNGKSIFLPAAGSFRGTSLKQTGSSGKYWSREPRIQGNNAYILNSRSDVIETSSSDREVGLSVRPVRVQK